MSASLYAKVIGGVLLVTFITPALPNYALFFLPLAVTPGALPRGRACHSGSTHISAVLGAMGVPRELRLGNLRLSLGRHSTEQEVDLAASHIIRAVKSLQR